MLKLITSGNARGEKGIAAAPRLANRALTTVIMCGPAAAAIDYSRSSGRRSQTHPPATAPEPSRSTPLETQIRHNKGFQATAHNLSLCNRFSSLQSYILMPVGRRLNPDVLLHGSANVQRISHGNRRMKNFAKPESGALRPRICDLWPISQLFRLTALKNSYV